MFSKSVYLHEQPCSEHQQTSIHPVHSVKSCTVQRLCSYCKESAAIHILVLVVTASIFVLGTDCIVLRIMGWTDMQNLTCHGSSVEQCGSQWYSAASRSFFRGCNSYLLCTGRTNIYLRHMAFCHQHQESSHKN